jgi:hypothetical protein
MAMPSKSRSSVPHKKNHDTGMDLGCGGGAAITNDRYGCEIVAEEIEFL